MNGCKLIGQQSSLENDRMDRDLRIASTLSAELKNSDYITILDGGYGVDAVCNSKLTRFHHDLDLIILRENIQMEEARKIVLNNIRETGWVENETSSGWLWFTKDDQAKPNLPRQINIHLVNLAGNTASDDLIVVRSSKGKEYKFEITKSHITSTDTMVYEFKTLVPEEYAATKLRLIPKYAPDWKIRECDEYDLGLLFQYSNFNIEKCVSILSTFYAAINDGCSNLDNSRPITPKEIFSRLIMEFPHLLTKDQKNLINSLPQI